MTVAAAARRRQQVRVAGAATAVLTRVLERQRDEDSADGTAKPTIRRRHDDHCRERKEKTDLECLRE